MLHKKEGCKFWIFRTRVNGKTWDRSTGETDRKKAEAKAVQLAAQAELHRRRPAESLSLEKAILAEVERLETDVSEQQALRVRDGLMNFLKWCRKTLKKKDISLDRIETAILEDYQRQRLKDVARSTVDKELCYTVRLLRNNGFRVDRPKAKRGKETLVREFTDGELEKFFQHCPEDQKAMFLLMFATGARPAEIVPSHRSGHVALLKKEVDAERMAVTIRTAKMKAGEKGEVRVIRVDEELIGMLEDAARRNPGQHVFPILQNLARYFDRIIKNAGIEKMDALGRKLTAHSFRHTWATRMAEAVGGNQFLLSRLLGHKQIATTNRYVHAKAQANVVEIGRYMQKPHQASAAVEERWGRRPKSPVKALI